MMEASNLRPYAGIGARTTPQDVCTLMRTLADHMERGGWLLRSGHAPGADQAFEAGTSVSEVYLPWPSYELRLNVASGKFFTHPTAEAYAVAAEHHPRWHKLQQPAKNLLARNVHQILGRSLEDPVSLVVCWTPGGRDVGGTGFTLRLARSVGGITIRNLATTEDRVWAEGLLTRA